MKIASVGECMVELRRLPNGTYARGFGGDTLNTAIYLTRLGCAVDYITALGDDAWSDEMLAAWAAEGVGTGQVRRMAGRLPGIYIIETDQKGERRFLHWRKEAPARELFSTDQAPDFAGYDLIYFSGITLSLYGEAGRAQFMARLQAVQAKGARLAFDTNYRPRNWRSPEEAGAAFQQALALADFVFAAVDDITPIFGTKGVRDFAPAAEVIVKLTEPACLIDIDGIETTVRATPVAQVVDTTAAGDSFAAAYLAARMQGKSALDAAEAGHALAGLVVQHPGAIIARDKMPKPA